MEILGIGAPELALIVLIALIVLGPKDMQKAGRTIGRWLNDLVHSDSWRVVQKTSHELRNLPGNLMREANLEMMKAGEDLRKPMKLTSVRPPADTAGQPPSLDNSSHVKKKASIPAAESNHTILPPDKAVKNEERSNKD